jgi:hypothetical protein
MGIIEFMNECELSDEESRELIRIITSHPHAINSKYIFENPEILKKIAEQIP